MIYFFNTERETYSHAELKTDSVILKSLSNLKIYVYGYHIYIICAPLACLESYRLVKSLGFPGNRVRDSCEAVWLLRIKHESSVRASELTH